MTKLKNFNTFVYAARPPVFANLHAIFFSLKNMSNDVGKYIKPFSEIHFFRLKQKSKLKFTAIAEVD